MIDIRLIIENKEKVKEGLLKRMEEKDLNLELILETYNIKKQKLGEFEDLRSRQNSFNQIMAKTGKGSEEFKKQVEQLKGLAEDVKKAEEELREYDSKLEDLLLALPNIPDEDVVAGGKESNQVIKEQGTKPTFDFKLKDHVDLGNDLKLFDFERAAKMSGASFPMYLDKGARLEWALINYFISEHTKDGYQMVMPPHMLNEQSGVTAGQLPKFKEDVYWVQDGNFMLPTAESALANIYRGETLAEEDLPKKFFAYTPCYRREAGSYRANERGLMRMHQFNKVEMFQYTLPQYSEVALEELLNRATKLVEDLGLHYRVTKLAAADCSAGAAKTYDVEVYMPFLDTYYEVSSISNVREYQSRRGEIKFKPKDGGKPAYVHMLNASGLATSRLLVALLETYQNADGSITVPEVLRPFTGFDKIEK
jgi:seryl-tRNA synthetase